MKEEDRRDLNHEEIVIYRGKGKPERKNMTHHISTWDDWCEICEEYDEDPYTCREITIGDRDGSNWESFEFDGNPQKMD